MPIIDQLVPDAATSPVPPEWFLPSVHSMYFQIFSQMLGLPLSASQREGLEQPRLLPLLDYLPIFDATHALAQPHVGRQLGQRVPMAAHGAMGTAAMVSGSIAQAMRTMARYAHIRNRLFDFECRHEGGQIVLCMHPRIALHGYRVFVENATVFAKFALLRAMAQPAQLRQARILLPWPAPEAGHEPHEEAGPHCIHNAPMLGYAFDAQVAERPSVLADPQLYRHACQAGDEELERLRGSLSAKVRQVLHGRQPHWPSLDEVAQVLSMSRRTLLRRLESEKISYQQLLDEARNELACWYLRQSQLPLSQVAEKIGFGDQTNFSRSFKRWKGLTPKDYRRQYAPSPR